MITILCTTHRPASRTMSVASFYRNLLQSKGTEAVILSMDELPRDFILTDMFDRRTDTFLDIINNKIVPAEKLIAVVPEYNGSLPGIFKTFLDACPPEIFYGKKTALTGIADGRAGNQRGLDHLTSIFHHLKMEVLSTRVLISGIAKEMNENGGFNNPATVRLIEKQLDLFLKF
jgi:NAD(P)H-dependent FMN reductase